MLQQRYKIFEAFGIPIYVNLSFIILLAIFVTEFGSFSFGIAAALTLAISVTAHELGHALTAGAFGYRTQSITLSLLGGCAALIALPRKAWQEFLTAIAGPLVSFLLALVAYLVLAFAPIRNIWLARVLVYMFWMNIMLGSFNLLPGFPMDGGRVFRSVMRIFTTRAKATYYAMVVGRVAAVALVVLPLLGIRHIWFIPIGGYFFVRLLIAYMIWQEGYREYLVAQQEERLEGWDFRAKVSPPPYEM